MLKNLRKKKKTLIIITKQIGNYFAPNRIPTTNKNLLKYKQKSH